MLHLVESEAVVLRVMDIKVVLWAGLYIALTQP